MMNNGSLFCYRASRVEVLKKSICRRENVGVLIIRSHRVEGEELHQHSWVPCNFPRAMAVSKLLQHFNIYYSAARMNEEPLQNIRIHSSDIFCQLHHYFSQFWAWKGFTIPDACQHCAYLNFFFQQTTKIYITALFGVHFNLLGNYSRDVSSYNVLLMCQPDVTSLMFSHFKFCAIRSEMYLKKKNLSEWHDGNGMKYIYISSSIDFFCFHRGRKHTDA